MAVDPERVIPGPQALQLFVCGCMKTFLSEDRLYDSIEFNEFLLLMSKQQHEALDRNSLVEAFRVFDKSGEGVISVESFHSIMTK